MEEQIEAYVASSLGFQLEDLVNCIRELEYVRSRNTNSSTLLSVRRKYAANQYRGIHKLIFTE